MYHLIWRKGLILSENSIYTITENGKHPSLKIKLLQINLGNFGSTGSIMINIGKLLELRGGEAYYAYPKSRVNDKIKLSKSIMIGTVFERFIHVVGCLITGFNGCFSFFSTLRFLACVNNIKPDVIHLHNLHDCYINLPLLFYYLKKKNYPVVWTLHDCWSFTGQCPYYSVVECYKWKTGCYKCPQYMLYPKSYVDQTKLMYKLKKKWFTGIPQATIVTVSNWLADQFKESYLNKYPLQVIQNGIDLDVFKPTENNFRKDNNCEDKFIVLGVSFGWSKRKGIDIFIDLCSMLPEEFQIVMVGVSDDDRRQLPGNCIALGLTSNIRELVEIYSAADIFLNPSKEETMGLVTVEALACGTPVVTSNLTAVPEVVTPECGIVVDEYSSESFARILLKKPSFDKEKCLARAQQYEKTSKYNEYINLYLQKMSYDNSQT